MATQPQLSQQATNTATPGSGEMKTEAALERTSPKLPIEGVLGINPLVSRLPVEIDVAVPIGRFRVRNLLMLSKGAVIASQWTNGDDMPLSARGAQLAWTEFEVIDQRLAVRITRLV